MSKTLIPFFASDPLQLDFFEAGANDRFTNGLRHQKTVPYTIVAQACEGSYEVRCNDRHEIIPAGCVFLIPTQTPVYIIHRAGKRGVMSARWVHFRFSLFQLIDYASLFTLPLKPGKKACLALGLIIGQTLRLGSDWHNRPMLLLRRHELALRTLKILCAESDTTPDSILEQSRWHQLGPVLQYVQAHISEELSVEKLARVGGFSAVHFHAVFKKEFGVGPMKYVWRMRLDLASRRLATKDWTLSQIADSVGFKDPFHFSHAFKAHFNMSPKAYRAQSSITML